MPLLSARSPDKTEDGLAARVYTQLQAAILDGRLPPGSALSRRQLADEFAVSALPVAAALQRLEAEGFVESRPRAGTRVRIPTAEAIRGNYVVREALETHSARLFAEGATPSQRRKLLEAAGRLDADFASLVPGSTSLERHGRVERSHVQFHIGIARSTRCQELVEAIERSRVLLFNWLFSAAGEVEPLPAHWHLRLAEALVQPNATMAAEAMRMHVRYRLEEAVAKFAPRSTERPSQPLVRGPQRRTREKANGAQTAAAESGSPLIRHA